MVICGNKHYDSFEELGNAMLAHLPKERQRVKWWRGWHFNKGHFTYCMAKTPWQKIKVWLPHFSKSRSWVGYFWLHAFLFNRWAVMFTCGDYKFEEEKEDEVALIGEG